MVEDDGVATFWRRQRQWSILADRLKARIGFWRSTMLILSASGVLLQTLAAALSQSWVGPVAGVIGAVALVFVPFIARQFLTAERVRGWLRARSVSEGLKSQIYRYCANAEPYTGADRASKLNEIGKNTEVWADELALELADIEADSHPPPGPLDAASYLRERVTDQIESYYRPHARLNARLAKIFRNLELASSATAAALGTLASVLQLRGAADSAPGSIGAWVGVLTTIGAGLAAHAAANRYDQQARMYFATARQLEDLRREWIAKGGPTDAKGWSEFVTACEEAISAENRGWMAKLDVEEKLPTAALPTSAAH